MKLNRLILILLFITVLGCKLNKAKSEINVKQEISNLNTLSQKESFLESIHYSDQKIRGGEGSELLLEYGKESSEFQNFIFRMDSIDQLNLKRVDAYLKVFGYPDIDSVSRNANVAPWLVIHHSTDIPTRKKFFPILNESYKNGNINSDQFELFLARTYQIVKGNYPVTEGSYNSKEKIDRLIKELELN